jgi:dihydrofolate reductase
MRQVILQEFVSLDGLAAGANASVDFIPTATKDDHSFEQHQLQFARTIDTILLGRVTYQMFAGYWPTATVETDKAADMLNLTPKVVFSKTLDQAPWGKYQLVVCPVVLGSGTPLFGDQAPRLDLKLQEAKTFDRGEVTLKYIQIGR